MARTVAATGDEKYKQKLAKRSHELLGAGWQF
jgi:hypothetical protein